MILKLNSLSPYVKHVRINKAHRSSQIYIDPEYVFTYILEGKGKFLLEGRSYSVKKGDIILMSPHMLHVVKKKLP